MQITHTHTHKDRRLPFARPTEAAPPLFSLLFYLLSLFLLLSYFRLNVIVIVVFVVVAGKI